MCLCAESALTCKPLTVFRPNFNTYIYASTNVHKKVSDIRTLLWPNIPTPTTQKSVLNGSNDLDNYVYINWSYGSSIFKNP